MAQENRLRLILFVLIPEFNLSLFLRNENTGDRCQASKLPDANLIPGDRLQSPTSLLDLFVYLSAG